MRIQVHDWNIDKKNQKENQEKSSDEPKVGDNAIAEAGHGIFAFFKMEVKLQFVWRPLTIVVEFLVF